MLKPAMRLICAIAALVLPLAAHAAAIGYEGARHLLNRAGFGATDAEVAELATLERGEAVERRGRGAEPAAGQHLFEVALAAADDADLAREDRGHRTSTTEWRNADVDSTVCAPGLYWAR